MKPSFAILLLLSLVLCLSFLHFSEAEPYGAPRAAPPPGFCDTKCAERCSKAKEIDRCLKYCGICCHECKCVPSGTHGNKSECPCYNDKLNSKGTAKCP